MDIRKALKAFGLTEPQIKIYKTLLELIEAPVYVIAKRSKLPRTTTYTALDQLQNQGLVLSFKKNQVLHYTPESPKKFLDLLESKQKLMKEVLPDMHALINQSQQKTTVKFYTGKESIKQAKEDVLETLGNKKHRELLVIANDAMFEVLPKYFPKWTQRRVDIGIHAKTILPHSAVAKDQFSTAQNKKTLREVQFLPKGFQHESSVNIYDDKVAFFSLHEGNYSALILQSKPLSDFFRQFFTFTWRMLESTQSNETEATSG